MYNVQAIYDDAKGYCYRYQIKTGIVWIFQKKFEKKTTFLHTEIVLHKKAYKRYGLGSLG